MVAALIPSAGLVVTVSNSVQSNDRLLLQSAGQTFDSFFTLTVFSRLIARRTGSGGL